MANSASQRDPDYKLQEIDSAIKNLELKIASDEAKLATFEKNEATAIKDGEDMRAIRNADTLKELKESLGKVYKYTEVTAGETSELEKWAAIASKIAENPEESPFKLMNKCLGVAFKYATFEDRVQNADKILTDWVDSWKGKQTKEQQKQEQQLKELLLGPEEVLVIAQAFPQYFNEFQYQGDQSKQIEFWYSPEAWQGVSESYYQEAAWRKSVLLDLHGRILSLEWLVFKNSTSPNEELPNQPNINQLREMQAALAKRKAEKEQELEKYKALHKKYMDSLIASGATLENASDAAHELAAQIIESEQRSVSENASNTQGYNSGGSQLRTAPFDSTHGGKIMQNNFNKGMLTTREGREFMKRAEEKRGTYVNPAKAGVLSLLDQIRNAKMVQGRAERDSEAQLESVTEYVSNGSPLDDQARVFENQPHTVPNGPSAIESSSKEGLGVGVGVVSSGAKAVGGFAAKKGLMALLAAAPTGVTQAAAAVLALADQIKKLPIADKLADAWVAFKKLVRKGFDATAALVLSGNPFSLLFGFGGAGFAFTIPVIGPFLAPVFFAGGAWLGSLVTPGSIFTGVGSGAGVGGFTPVGSIAGGGVVGTLTSAPVLAVAGTCCLTVLGVATVSAAFQQPVEAIEKYDEPVFEVKKEIQSVQVGGQDVNFKDERGINRIENPDGQQVKIIYKITFTSKGEKISITQVEDTATSFKASRDPFDISPSPKPDSGSYPTLLTPEKPETVTMTIDINGGSNFALNDSRLVNTIKVIGTSEGTDKTQTQSAVASLKIGNPVGDQPYNFPLAGSITTLDTENIKNGGCHQAINPVDHESYGTHCGEMFASHTTTLGGIDIAGTGEVKSTIEGIVEVSSFDPDIVGGKLVIVDFSGEYRVSYLHLKKDGLIAPGSKVSRGAVIGQVYDKADYAAHKLQASSGPHVHYQITQDGLNLPFATAPVGQCSDGIAIMSEAAHEIVVKKGTLTATEVANNLCD